MAEQEERAGQELGCKAEHVHYHVNTHVRFGLRQFRSESTQAAPHSYTFPHYYSTPAIRIPATRLPRRSMSKRKRALSSSDRDGDTLALTRDNLRRLQESLSPPPNMSR
jgi:hypothetical protein